jgi:hypothetical protein
MPQADFQVTLQFRGYPVPEGVVGGDDHVQTQWLADFASAVTSHARGSGMCEDWRNAFRGDEAYAHDLEESQPQVQTFYVTIRPQLSASLAVNGTRTPQDAAAMLESVLRNSIEWNTVDGTDGWDLSEVDVQVGVDHQGTYDVGSVPDDYSVVDV